MIFRFADYVLDVDVERTRAFYSREDVKVSSAQCVCQGCQNYDGAILSAPETVLDFLRSLGIDPRKPAEVYDVMGQLDEDGKVRYNGFYHVCGVRLQGENAWVSIVKDMMHLDENRMYAVDESFKVSFEEKAIMIHQAFPEPVLQMEIDARLPWVLPTPYQA